MRHLPVKLKAVMIKTNSLCAWIEKLNSANRWDYQKYEHPQDAPQLRRLALKEIGV
ncbi:MAG: hypothetical protein L6282_06720 [Candidatus Methanoperedenaceae archaeon]|nr:hypothetical protein [Candidatus Methanoperedenaceae archaeon]